MADDPATEQSFESRLDEVLADFLAAQERSPDSVLDDYTSRFPEFAQALRDFVADQRRLEKVFASASTHDLASSDPEAKADPDATAAEAVANDPHATADGDSPADFEAGRRIKYFGEFELLRELNRGGMGMVFQARQSSLGRVVALKMILSSFLRSPAAVNRFRAEASAVARLNHPGIVPIFEFGEHDGEWYYTMEFMEGGSLQDKIRSKPLAWKEAVKLTAEICRAIHHAHEKGIVHRDLKPANILVDGRGVLKVADFGLVKEMDNAAGLTHSGQAIGTPSYMAPEQAGGDPDVGPLADVYSLGAILYALLTGAPPFRAATTLETLRQVREVDPVPPRRLDAGIPRDVETVCLKPLLKDRRRRYETAAAFADDMEALLTNRPIKARPVGRIEKSWKWVRRNQTLAAFTALVTCLAVALPVYQSFVNAKLAAANQSERRQKIVAEESQRRASGQQKVAERNERLATRERDVANQTVEVLERCLGSNDLFGMLGLPMKDRRSSAKEPTVKDVLNATIEELERNKALDPGSKGRIYDSLGSAYLWQGDFLNATKYLATASPLVAASDSSEVQQRHLINRIWLAATSFDVASAERLLPPTDPAGMSPLAAADMDALRCWILFLEGRQDDSMSLLQKVIGQLTKEGVLDQRPVYRLALSLGHLRQKNDFGAYPLFLMQMAGIPGLQDIVAVWGKDKRAESFRGYRKHFGDQIQEKDVVDHLLGRKPVPQDESLRSAEREYAELSQLSESSFRPGSVLDAFFQLDAAGLFVQLGDERQIGKRADELLERFKPLGRHPVLSLITERQADLMLSRGDDDRALKFADETLALLRGKTLRGLSDSIVGGAHGRRREAAVNLGDRAAAEASFADGEPDPGARERQWTTLMVPWNNLDRLNLPFEIVAAWLQADLGRARREISAANELVAECRGLRWAQHCGRADEAKARVENIRRLAPLVVQTGGSVGAESFEEVAGVGLKEVARAMFFRNHRHNLGYAIIPSDHRQWLDALDQLMLVVDEKVDRCSRVDVRRRCLAVCDKKLATDHTRRIRALLDLADELGTAPGSKDEVASLRRQAAELHRKLSPQNRYFASLQRRFKAS